MKVKTIERITKARIQIQQSNPFFAYLSLYLKFKERKDIPTCGVNSEGDFFYNEKFINELDGLELKAVLIHEVLHLAFLHLIRVGKRDKKCWNCACDVAVNQIIKDNGFKLPKDCLLSDRDNTFIMGEIIIKDCDKKNAEMIYDELIKHAKKNGGQLNGNGEGEGEGMKSFDEHIFRESEGGTEEEEEQRIKDISDTWTERLQDAYTTAKMRGKTPNNIGRLIELSHKSKVNWKALLNKYITNSIPYDYTFNKPHKKSIASGFFMPNILKQKIEVIVALDLSGSITNEELGDFISEIIAMARAFRTTINFRFLTHDVEVNNDYEIQNGNIKKIKSLNLNGGGGTSHIPIFNYIKEKYRENTLSIFFTDGESDIDEIDFKKYSFDKLFLISKDGTDKQINKKQARIIKID